MLLVKLSITFEGVTKTAHTFYAKIVYVRNVTFLFAAVVVRSPVPASDHRVQPELLHDARPLLRLLGRRRIQGEPEGRPLGRRGRLRWILH